MALRDAFNPSGKCDWQTAVLARGVGMLGQLNNHLA
jgi:hypothetical protein